MAIAHRTDLPPTAQSHVDVQISPVIAADFEKRQVFPELLRPAEAIDRINYSHIYRVTVDYAEKVLEDAQDRRQDRTLPKGMPRAFTVLIDRLREDVRRAKGIWHEPGREIVVARRAAELATFQVGDRVRYWCPLVDREIDGKMMTIVHPYGLHRVAGGEGEYMDKEGDRVTYRPGYVAKDDKGEHHFYPPCEIQTTDYKPGHLKLVWSRP